MRSAKGFTLIEMMIVILVISVLATIVGLSVKNAGERAKNATLTAHLTTLQNAVDLYNNDVGTYPQNLTDCTSTSNSDPNYNGPYVRAVPRHPYTKDPNSYTVDATTGLVTETH